MELILKYFPNLTDRQLWQFEQIGDAYREWNEKINVISRKDIDNLYLHHVLHSLSIAKFIHFKSGSKIFDLGTGGGFPAVPLAILFPEVQFTAADGIKKKIRVVEEIKAAAEIKNVKPLQARGEEHRGKYDFVVTRAVAKVDKLKMWSERIIEYNNQKHTLPNGIIALKGGNIKEETSLLTKKDYFEVRPLVELIDEPYFDEKFIFYLQR